MAVVGHSSALCSQGRLVAEEVCMADLWKVFYFENQRLDQGTLRVANRSPTPISKSNDFRGQSEDIWGARGLHFRPILGVPGARAGQQKTYFLARRNGKYVCELR